MLNKVKEAYFFFLIRSPQCLHFLALYLIISSHSGQFFSVGTSFAFSVIRITSKTAVIIKNIENIVSQKHSTQVDIKQQFAITKHQ